MGENNKVISKPSIEQLEEASVRENTRKAYASDVSHYRNVYCGLLPALPNHLVDYLHTYCDQLAPDTLSRRLAGISAWHLEHGFADYTNHERVRKILKGIRHFYGVKPRQAHPLVLTDVDRIVKHIDFQLAKPVNEEMSEKNKICLYRDRALLLYMFWRGLRAHQAVTLEASHINTRLNGKWEITYLPDKTHEKHYQMDLFEVSRAALRHLCPIRALQTYIEQGQLYEGPVFSKIYENGDFDDKAMHPNSLNPWIKSLANDAGLGPATGYSISSHSPRTGFATSFASELGIKVLMQYMGWRSERVAIRYIQAVEADVAIRSITSDCVNVSMLQQSLDKIINENAANYTNTSEFKSA